MNRIRLFQPRALVVVNLPLGGLPSRVFDTALPIDVAERAVNQHNADPIPGQWWITYPTDRALLVAAQLPSSPPEALFLDRCRFG